MKPGMPFSQPFFRRGLGAFLRACGIDTGQHWWQVLAAMVLVRAPAVAWTGNMAAYFPHIDFSRLRAGDILRVPLQLLWLALVRQPDSAWLPVHKRITGALAGGRGRAASARHWLRKWLHSTDGSGKFMLRTKALACKALWPDFKHIRVSIEAHAEHRYWDIVALRVFAYALAALMALLCITTPFSLAAQTVFVAMLWCVALLIKLIPGQVATLFLIVLSVTASTRYLWWRINYTLNWDQTLDMFWGLLLVAAEIYTWIILILGYIQTAWPLNRTPTPLPAGREEWPSVDVFIPTYNEPMSVVKPTVFAAIGMDWPPEKLNIYILDDGRRSEFREFAAKIGVGYMIRPDNFHAKAGNLNHAMTKTNGEFIAIFDCDHLPTRSFLQISMGWFQRDPKLALLQTPHHFFSPDPFERNLGLFRTMPNEGELFYGLIQDGNDLWNATFFCGSCAVLRRGPLEQVGGIAVETVTEDAHTALKFKRLGYTSAYLSIPQAAGLATESLSAHIGQRIRWARGMAQIFRLDNPFLGRGLSWAQRVCYGNAMMHFFNGGPRLVFLTAPLAYLLFHAYVIYTPALAVMLYVLPHMAHANLTNSRIQGEHRKSFWGEVYETVLAWYIVRPTMVALINPRLGTFNVTAKGGLVESEYFDIGISLPYLVLVGFCLAGFVAGIVRLFFGPGNEIGTTLFNLFWILYNLVLLGAAAAVAEESKQVRRSHRVQLHLPAILHLPNGRLVRCHTEDFSEGGTSLVLSQFDLVESLEPASEVMVSLYRGEEEFVFPARVIGKVDPQLRLRWDLHTREQEIALVQCTFARADAWVSWAEGRDGDRPFTSLYQVYSVGLMGYARIAQYLMPGFSARAASLGASVARWVGGLLPRMPTRSATAKPE